MSAPPIIKRTVHATFDAVLARLPAVLQEQGFGLMTEIDVQGALRDRLGITFRRYKIFGACRPAAAYKVLSSDLDIGVLLPCNIVVYEGDDGTHVVAVDPLRTVAAAAAAPGLRSVMADIEKRLTRILDELAGAPAEPAEATHV
jgi:uncharacterized protein (DUF302 family)